MPVTVNTAKNLLLLFALLLIPGSLLLTPSYAQVPSGTPTYAVNAKWVTDHGSEVYNTLAYTQGTDCGLSETYTTVASTGGTILLGADCTISSAATLTAASNKALFLDLGGHTLTLALATGVTGLTLTESGGRYPIVIRNGVIAASGTGTGVTGILVTGPVESLKMEDLEFRNFSTTGSNALIWDDVEDSEISNVQFNGNYNALILRDSSNQNHIQSAHFQANVNPITVSGSGGITFTSPLIQSNTGPVAVQLGTDAGGSVSRVIFDGACHLENNGDGTANSRAFVFDTPSGQYTLNNEIKNCMVSSGTYGSLGTAIGFTGAGAASNVFLKLENNYWIGYAAMTTGTLPTSFIGVNDNHTIGSVPFSLELAPELKWGATPGLCATSTTQIEVNNGTCASGTYEDFKANNLNLASSVNITTGQGVWWPLWGLYTSGSALYLRDLTNALMAVACWPGATNTGYCNFAGSVGVGNNLNFSANGSHLDTNSSTNDFDGKITVASGASSGSYSFTTAYGSAPACVASPIQDMNPTTLRWWVTTSTAAVTVNTSANTGAALVWTFHCAGYPN